MKFFSGGSKAVQTGTLITGQVWSYTYTGANTDTTSDGIRTITITSSGIFTPDYDMSATVTVQGGGTGGASSAFGVSANGGAGGVGTYIPADEGVEDLVAGAAGSGGPGALTANGGTGGVNTTSSTVSATAGGAGRVQIQFAV